MTMDPTELKKNFEEQIAKTETQIVELEKNLEKAKEYKTKLLGGLETIGLLTDEPVAAEAPGTPSSVEPTE